MKKNRVTPIDVAPDEFSQRIIDGVLRQILPILIEYQRKEERYLMRPSEAAKFLRISESSVRKLVREGKLKGCYPATDLRLMRDDMIRFIEESTIKNRRG